VEQPLRLRVAKEEFIVFTDFLLDLRIVWQDIALDFAVTQQLFGSLRLAVT
jgi:hypothetical protein